MAFDVSKAALPALWKADDSFREIAKYLYGDDVTLETIQKDLFGKSDPGPSDVHINQPVKVGRKKKPLVVDERGIEKYYSEERSATPGELEGLRRKHPIESRLRPKKYRTGYATADDDGNYTVEAGADKSGIPTKRVKHFSNNVYPPTGVEKSLEIIGKAFIDLVEKAYDAGLIDDQGNLDMVEINKSREYVRDHAGRFASQGKHTGRIVAGLAAAGALAGTGALLGSKTPKAMKYAGESVKFIGHHLKSADPAERHVARSLLPHALKATGKAVGTAGVGATAAAGGVYEATRTYQNMREHRPHVKAARAEAVEKLSLREGALRAGAEYVTRGTQLGNKVEGYIPRHASELSRVKRLRRLGGEKVRETALDTHAPAEMLRNNFKPLGDITKNAHDVVWEGDFSKVDEDKRQVFGWASVTEMDGKPVVDLQGDYIHPDEIEKAAYDYVLKSRVGGDMHTRVDAYGNVIEKSDKPLHVSDLIESVVFTPEKCEAMGVSKDLAGRWWTGFQINDPGIWTEVKEGRRTGFSIHGAGLRKSVEIEELDPESELIGKAYQESDSVNEFIDNLCTLEDVTGHEGFGDLAKHLAHGITTPQVNAQQARNAGVYGSMGSGVGGLAGGVIGAKFGHVGEGAGLGAGVGGVTGTAVGVATGREKKSVQRPQRPPSLAGVGMKAARYDVEKAVDNTNRMGGGPGARQNFYQQYALQQATEMLAPQVAQHIQAMQEQRWQQQMIEQQMLQQQSQQQPQNFAVQMGPYANHQSEHSSGSQQNPLAPSQQGPTTPSMPSAPTPQTMSI